MSKLQLFYLLLLLSIVGCATTTPSPTVVLPSVTPIILRPSDPPPLVTPTAPFIRSTPQPTTSALLTAPAVGTPSTQAVAILMYHQIKELPPNASASDRDWTVSPSALDAQLNYLSSNGYVTLSLDQALDGLSGRTTLPAKAVVLTFDDGWKTQHAHALPLFKKYKQTATFYVVSSYMGYGAYFDWPMIMELKQAGMTIGSHTIGHVDLTKKNSAELERELRESKASLEKQLQANVTHLAYPFGAYNDVVIEAVRRAGYRTATTINPTLLRNPVLPYRLPRLRVSYQDTLADFAKKLP